MDFIVIGKAERFTDAPQVIYCGTSSIEARAAVDAAGGKFRRVYRVGQDPIQYYKVAKAYAAQADAPVAQESEPEQPKRKSKKS